MIRDAVLVVDGDKDYEEIDIIDAVLRQDGQDFITTEYQGKRYWVHGGPGKRTDRFINIRKPLQGATYLELPSVAEYSL